MYDNSPAYHAVIAAFIMLSVTVFTASVAAWYTAKRTGKGGPIMPFAAALGFERVSSTTCQGQLRGSPAQVEIDDTGAVWLTVGVDRPPSFVIQRDGLVGMLERWLGTAVPSGDAQFDGRFVVTSATDRGRAKAALDTGLRDTVKELFDRHQVTQLDTVQPAMALYKERHHFGAKQRLRARVAKLDHLDAARVLGVLETLARHLEGMPLHVVRLGAERRAVRSSEGRARCPYCRGDVTGEEPDLVACDRCHTVVHEGCWAELGGCPTFACGGKTPEVRTAARAPS